MPYMAIGQINSVFTVFRRRQSLSVRVMPYMAIGQINSVFTVFRRRQSLSVRVDRAIVVCARLG